ncbi:hypothetical protein [Sphingomonas sp.]|uniref:hypothetical protein n=1 Tax=Sphingomonas sp. TaxID=28214 RepID=UPI001B0E0914|nr:hypothetical protein [Sphingomonas sp.]MBO9713980.1 hypothetical protein [Sphingomonas sp.]
MSGDEPSLEPARGLPPLGSHVLIGALAFVGGIAGTALVLQWSGGSWHAPAPPPPPVVQAPAPASPPGTDAASLSAREQALAARLDQLESRLNTTDSGARTASGYASQAERLLIASAARRAIERGIPLGTVEPQLRRRFGEDHGEAVATIIQAAREPVTIEDLRLALDTIAPRLAQAPDDSPWMMLRRVVGDLVVLRPADSPSPRTADRMLRARRQLDAGKVEAALAEVSHMPGVDNAASWVTAAKRYVAARAALNEIEAAAMETPPAPPAPAPQPARSGA